MPLAPRRIVGAVQEHDGVHARRGIDGALELTIARATAGAVTRLEQSEAGDRIRLDTLRRAADALECDLVYLLIPRRPLTTVVRERAGELAHWQVAAVEQTMSLEDQATGQTQEMEDQLTQQLLDRGGLWNDTSRAPTA
jgi:transcriptional regulator with XRE-family HTH domain